MYLYMAGKFMLGILVSHSLPSDELNKASDLILCVDAYVG